MAFWDPLSVDSEVVWSQISCSGTQMCSKIDLRIINFGTWVLGRSPGAPRGVPKGRLTGPCPLFRGRFGGHFACQNLLISESIFYLEKSELREDFHGFWSRFGRAYPHDVVYIQAKPEVFHFELVGFRERFWHRKALKMTSK